MSEIPSEIHRIDVPTPFAVGSMNCYLIEGSPLTLIDTGPYSEDALSVLTENLNEIGHQFADIDQIILTHGHLDHSGLASSIRDSRDEGMANVFIHEADVQYVKDFESYIKTRIDSYLRLIWENGVPSSFKKFITKERYVGYFSRYSKSCSDIITITDDSVFSTGLGMLELIWTPGHSRGSCCYYLKDKKVVFTGDHVIGDISSNPSLDFDNPSTISMLSYFDSLTKLDKFGEYIALPGHRTPIWNLSKRIEELRIDYEEKFERLRGFLSDDAQSIYSLSRKMYGEYDVDSLVLALAETLDLVRILEMQSLAEILYIDEIRKVRLLK